MQITNMLVLKSFSHSLFFFFGKGEVVVMTLQHFVLIFTGRCVQGLFGQQRMKRFNNKKKCFFSM